VRDEERREERRGEERRGEKNNWQMAGADLELGELDVLVGLVGNDDIRL
jgi:hypothetical protein